MAVGRKTKNILKFSGPSKWWGSGWREALVSGNGKIGCSVLGGAGQDSIMITHSDLWWQGKVGVLPEVCAGQEKVKKLIAEGKYKEAQEVLPDALIAKGYRPSLSYPLPLCDFNIKMHCDKPPKDYVRSVNMDTGEVTVNYRDGNTRFQRSVFVSRSQDYIIFEITRSGAKAIDAEFSFSLHEKFNNRTPQAFTNLPEGAATKTDGKFLMFAARSDSGTDFGAVAYINYFGGTLVPNEASSTVKGAEKLFIVIKPFINVKSRESKWKEIKDELKGFKLTYEKLLKEQVSQVSKVSGRAYLSLSDDDTYIDGLIQETSNTGEVPPALIEKLWGYGRYLFTSASSPASSPVAPYGIWCGDYKAPDSTLNADGSLQLCYEHALAGNLTDYLDSLFAHYDNVIDDLKKNAIRLYDCKGVFISPTTARGTGLIGQVSPEAIYFTGAAGWLCKLMYDCYLCNADIKLLKKILPFMKETAQFYTDFFQLQGDSFFESSPAYSPGSEPGNLAGEGVIAIKNPLIDFAIARELFENLIEGSTAAGANKNDIEKWKTFLQHIPPYKLNNDGTVMEYFDNKLSDNLKSGSSAMFYPVFPGGEVTEKSGEIFKQFEKTAQKRFSYGAQHTSVTLSRFANLFVRLNQTAAAEDIISAMVRYLSLNNLIFSKSDWSGMGVAGNDIWATYSIEPNLILTNAIQEMFVRSNKDTIWILPACNQTKGELGGFLTRCGVEIIELNWDRKRGQISLKLKAKKSCKISLKLADTIKRYKGGGSVDTEQNAIKDLELPANKAISLDIKI